VIATTGAAARREALDQANARVKSTFVYLTVLREPVRVTGAA
jgi:hypothetical protein